MNDEKIIELIRDGRADVSLNKLYKFYPVIRKMIISKGGSANDAEDTFQEALIILVRKISKNDFILTAQLSTYLFSVCRFLWKDELKKRNRHEFVDFDLEITASQEVEYEETIAEENRARLAEKVINELKERCRELLLTV